MSHVLDKVRRPGRAKNILAYIVFGAICLMFVFMGVGPGSMGGLVAGGSAAVVNNKVISLADYRQVYRNMEEQYSKQLSGVPAAQRQMFTSQLRSRALEELIDREVIAQSANNAGITVSDAEVRESIVSIPFFQEDGRFQRSRYNSYLQSSRSSAKGFETKMRKDLALNRLRGLFQKSLKPLDEERQKDQQIKSTKLNVAFVKLDRAVLKKNFKVSSSDIKAFLATEETRNKVNSYYKQNEVDYTDKEEVQARHILIKAEPGNKASEEQALAKIETIQKELLTGDFAKLAGKYSDDPGSKIKGGDLGFFSRGRMVPEFEEVAFTAEIGKVSDPVKTNFGYHLIKVEKRKAGGLRPLEDVESEIAKDLILEAKIAGTLKSIEEALAKGDFSKASSEVKSAGFKWEETGEFDLAVESLPKVGDNDRAIEAILSLKKPGQMVSELIKNNGKDYLFKLKQLKTTPSEGDDAALAAGAFDFGASRRATEAFTNWASEAKKVAKIQRNASLVAQ